MSSAVARLLFLTVIAIGWVNRSIASGGEIDLQFEDIATRVGDHSVLCAGFLPHKPRVIYICTEDKHVLFYDLDSKTVSGQTEFGDFRGPIKVPTWSRDGTKVAFRVGKEIFLHDFEIGSTTSIVKMDGLLGPAMVWVSERDLLFNTEDGIYRVDTKSRQVDHVLRGGTDFPSVYSYAAPTHKVIYSTTRYHKSKSDFSTLIQEAEFREGRLGNSRIILDATMGGEINPTATNDGRILVFVARALMDGRLQDDFIYFVDTQSGRYIRTVKDNRWRNIDCSISPDGTGLIVRSMRIASDGEKSVGRRKQIYHIRYAQLDLSKIIEILKEF